MSVVFDHSSVLTAVPHADFISYAHVVGVVCAALSALVCLLLCAKKAAVARLPSASNRKASAIQPCIDVETGTVSTTQESAADATSGKTRSTEDSGGECAGSLVTSTSLSGVITTSYTGTLLTVDPPTKEEVSHLSESSSSDNKRKNSVLSMEGISSTASQTSLSSSTVPSSVSEKDGASSPVDPCRYTALPTSTKNNTTSANVEDPSYAMIDPALKAQANTHSRRGSTKVTMDDTLSWYSSTNDESIVGATPPVCVSINDDPYASVEDVTRGHTQSSSMRGSTRGGPVLPAERQHDGQRSHSFCVHNRHAPLIDTEKKNRLLSVDLNGAYATPMMQASDDSNLSVEGSLEDLNGTYTLPMRKDDNSDMLARGSIGDLNNTYAMPKKLPDDSNIIRRGSIDSGTLDVFSSTVASSPEASKSARHDLTEQSGKDVYAAPRRLSKATEPSPPGQSSSVLMENTPYAAPNLPVKTVESLYIEKTPELSLDTERPSSDPTAAPHRLGKATESSPPGQSSSVSLEENPYAAPNLPVKTVESLYIEKTPELSLDTERPSSDPTAAPHRLGKATESSPPGQSSSVSLEENPYAAPDLPVKTVESLYIEKTPELSLDTERPSSDPTAAQHRLGKATESSPPGQSSSVSLEENPYAAPNLPVKTVESLYIEKTPELSLDTERPSSDPTAAQHRLGKATESSPPGQSSSVSLEENPYAAPDLPVKTVESLYIEKTPEISLDTERSSSNPTALKSVDSASAPLVPEGNKRPVPTASSHCSITQSDDSAEPVALQTGTFSSSIPASMPYVPNESVRRSRRASTGQLMDDTMPSSTSSRISEIAEEDEHYATLNSSHQKPSLPKVPARPCPSPNPKRSDSAMKRVANVVTAMTSLPVSVKAESKNVTDGPAEDASGATMRRTKSVARKATRRKSDGLLVFRTKSANTYSQNDDPYESVADVFQ